MNKVTWGCDLASEHEKYLTEVHFKVGSGVWDNYDAFIGVIVVTRLWEFSVTFVG